MTSTARSETGKTRRSLRHDTSGLALIYVTVALPVIIGMALLAVDFGRLATLQSSLQAGADSLALAGAAELDLRPDALTRANYAIDNLITQNKSLFATTVATINAGEVDRHFLDKIPANDATPIDASWLSAHEILTDGTKARFVVVKVNPQRFDTIFPATFLGASSNSAQSSAEATAGFKAAVCNFTPLFMCNPFETVGNSDVDADFGLFALSKTEAFRRRLIGFKSQGNQWSPGNFGFLQPFTGHGTGGLALAIASVSPSECFVVDDLNVDSATGNRQSLKKAFNVRLDVYANGNLPSGGGAWTDYPPSVNVRKGYVITGSGNAACQPNKNVPATSNLEAMGLPNDACFPNSCIDAGGRLGGGDWGGDTASTSNTVSDFYQYWNFNHKGNTANHPDRPIPSESDLSVDVDGNGTLGTTAIPNNAPPSRYSIYRYEIKKGWQSDKNSSTPAAKQETGTPQCQPTIATDTPDRRIIYGAIINCYANGLNGGQNPNLKALAFGKFFMTRPMEDDPLSAGNDVVLYTELVGFTEPGDADSVARDIVQLYR